MERIWLKISGGRSRIALVSVSAICASVDVVLEWVFVVESGRGCGGLIIRFDGHVSRGLS